ncbi:MAG TPA: sugar transferase [Cryomorphaceae bacterium]|nr:sugar transferase [Cryomorphaceae bacterium]
MLTATEVSKLHGYVTSDLLRYISPGREHGAGRNEIVKITDAFNLYTHRDGSLDQFTNLHRANDIRDLNDFFRTVNRKLKEGGVFIGSAETLEQRKERLFKKFPRGLNVLYYSMDFVLKRVFPKFKYTRKIYTVLTGGRNRALSKTELLGRLVYCGFSISDVKEIDNVLYFKATKTGPPSDQPEPSSGLLLKIERLGLRGKPITVYKFRTMHPYAQYIQEYVFEQNHLCEGGKFADDFRITKWGRWMRKFWIDEIPMLYNVLRGDIKLVGVRPISAHYMSLYTPEHKNLRMQGKPGLIPPFYADMPKSLEEIMESESRYIRAYVESPFSTDWNYCVKAFSNIFLHKARSH